MKKLVLSLLGAATLATASNAMALDTRPPYTVEIATRGVVPTFAGIVVFDFDSEAVNIPSLGGIQSPSGFPGSCVYLAEWLSNDPHSSGPLTLTAQCFLAEQRIHGAVSCLVNSLTSVPTVVQGITADPVFGPCMGFTPFGQINTIQNLQLGSSAWPAGQLNGVVQFDSMIANHTVYGIRFRA
jgi:hypothetical protein